jgi:hypothetical protein
MRSSQGDVFKYLLRVIVLWFGGFLAITAFTHVSANTQHRVALVVGAKDYQHVRSLDNTLNDSRRIRDKLKSVGFEVVYEENPTRDTFLKAINRFEDRLRKDSVALVYFAGHGAEVRGENFLIPVDAKGKRRDDIEHEAIRLQFLINKFTNIGSELNFVILDACRDDPFPSAGRSGAGGLTEIKNAPKGTLIAYAAAPGQKAIDGLRDGDNGVYTAALLRQIDQPGKKIEEVFKDVRAEVVKVTNNQQTPWENSSLVGDFFFVPKQVAIAPPSVPPPVQDRSTDLELTFWNSIKDSKNAADYQAYIDQFPKGTFVGLAKIRIRDLQPPQVVTLPKPAPSQPPQSQAKPPEPKPEVVKPDPPKPIAAPASIVYTDRAALNGKSFFGSSAGGNRWLMQMTIKGDRISVESMWLEMGAERFQMNCGGLFSPGLAIAADLTVSGNCTGGNTTRTVSGRFPDLTVGDTATSNYDSRWPATTASGAPLKMIDEGSRQAYLGGSQSGKISTKEWSESQRR